MLVTIFEKLNLHLVIHFQATGNAIDIYINKRRKQSITLQSLYVL